MNTLDKISTKKILPAVDVHRALLNGMRLAKRNVNVISRSAFVIAVFKILSEPVDLRTPHPPICIFLPHDIPSPPLPLCAGFTFSLVCFHFSLART
jgi:hypothetical protein